MAEAYLDGDPIAEISKRIFRSPAFVKSTLERVGVPSRPTGDDKFEVEYLPEACISEEFSIGEIAWNAVHHAPCEIREKMPELYNAKYGTNCYRVWIKERSADETSRFGMVSGGFSAYTAAYDLGKLEHLKAYGVKVEKIQ